MRRTVAVAVVLVLAWSSAAGAAEFGDRAAFTFTEGTGRIVPGTAERWTCEDSDGGIHEAYRIPGRRVSREGDTWILPGMTAGTCRSNTDLYFSRPGQPEQAWRVVVSGANHGQILYHEIR